MKLSKKTARIRRHNRVRAIVKGTAERPRICIFRSNKHISAQVIDDLSGRTLAAVSSVTKESKAAANKNYCNRATAEKLGKELGSRMKTNGIAQAVFDRGGYVYHGIIKSFADAVRSADEENHFHF